MKTVLAAFTNLDRIEEITTTARDIAAMFDGHVIGYYPIPAAFILTISDPAGTIPFDDKLQRQFQRQLPAAKKAFEDIMGRSGISFEWRDEQRIETNLTRAVLHHGRQCDLIIMGQETQGSKAAAANVPKMADVIMGAGRPVLVIPPGVKNRRHFSKVAIGWNASKEASRAVFDSMSILQKADEVYLLWANPDKKPNKSGMLPGSELAAALARHDVKATATGTNQRLSNHKIIQNFVNEKGIDLLVLGAYGHMRLREQILGGVTEHSLQNLNCPTLFSR
ncbi:MAG: universal stress protein [Hellea sp.]|nr:universal stress protein [Hellea sp.]